MDATILQDMQAMHDEAYGLTGEAASYVAADGGDAVAVTVLFAHLGADADGAEARVCVRRSELEDEPEPGAVFAVGGTDWTVADVLPAAEGTTSLQWALRCLGERRLGVGA